MLSTRCGSEGTIGNSGGLAGEEGYGWWVLWEYLILFQKLLTWGKWVLTSGYNGTGFVCWIRFRFGLGFVGLRFIS